MMETEQMAEVYGRQPLGSSRPTLSTGRDGHAGLVEGAGRVADISAAEARRMILFVLDQPGDFPVTVQASVLRAALT